VTVRLILNLEGIKIRNNRSLGKSRCGSQVSMERVATDTEGEFMGKKKE
jgi:hypothetical protein